MPIDGGQGRTVDFEYIVIMTSTLAANFGWAESSQYTRDTITQVLQAISARVPEPHRRDHHLPFANPSGPGQVVEIQLRHVSALLATRGYNWSSARRHAPISRGWLRCGLRSPPTQTAIQRELQDPLAVKILGGEFHEGDTICVNRGKEKLEFTALAPDSV